jgi:hypothetical protein
MQWLTHVDEKYRCRVAKQQDVAAADWQTGHGSRLSVNKLKSRMGPSRRCSGSLEGCAACQQDVAAC